MKKFFILIAFSFVYLTLLTNAQQLNYTANNPNYSIDLRKAGTNNPTSLGNLFTYNGSNYVIYEIGKLAATPTYAHGVYQWNISDLEIPNGSTIHSVTISFNFTWVQTSVTTINYFNCITDITDPNLNLTTLWNSTDKYATPAAIPIGEGGSSLQGSQYYVRTTYNNGSNFVSQFTNSINQNDRFTLGIAWKYESPEAGVTSWNFSAGGLFPSISVSYTPPSQTVTLDQRLSNNTTQVGKLRKWEGAYFTPSPFINPGTPFDFPINSVQTIQGDQAVYSNEKYNNWNADKTDVKNHHQFTITPSTTILTSKFEGSQPGITIKNSLEGTTVDGGQIKIKDPWLIDYPDPQYGNTPRNQGMSAQFREQTSPFSPDLSSSYNGYVYKGIFLNQSGPPLWNNTFYSVGSPTEQTIYVNNQSRKFYPFSWGGTGVTLQYEYYLETGIVFNSSNAVATGILKGQLMSNSTTGISSNSQRKMVRTDNGIYHVVYESMGNVFYTHSLTSNFDGEWAQDQLVLDNAKNPAIEYDGNIVKIVCENYAPGYSTNVDLWLLTYTQQANGKYENSDAEIFATCPSAYFGSAKPVISYNNGQIALVYRMNSTEGLKQRTKWNISGTWTWQAEATIPETNSNSINPSIIGEFGKVHIAFESLSTIKYKLAYSQGNNWQYNNLINLSYLSGYTTNQYPSISLSNSGTPYVMVSWLGVYNYLQEKILPKENDYVTRYAAVSKVGYGTSWGGFSSFSNYVNYTNNNSINSSAGSILAWSESNGQYSKFVKRNSNGTFGTITNLTGTGANGIQTMVSNGSGFNNIEVMVFNTSTSAPYLLNKCSNDFSQGALEKVGETETIDISYGRSGVVGKNGVEFVFNIGDVLLDDQIINFVDRVDTLPVVSIDEMNLAARTNTFSLSSESELIFSDYYYVVNKNLASTLSDEFSVSFKCELVNASTNQVVGTFDNITYNKFNVQEYANTGYLIDCSGIQSGNYYLRLFASANDDVDLSISDIQRDDINLEKSGLSVRNFKGEGIPIVYDLAQNFPNPFNPSTTIRYQIPQDGLVTLKIYDILGAEVATLVNEEKVAGKFEVNFNASSLASGVYIYKIQAGSFINSKKMIVLK